MIPIILILFLSIGFSAFTNNLLIDDMGVVVRPISNIRVTGVNYSTNSNGGVSNNIDYNIHNINGSVTLPSSDSSVTYTVVVTNIGNVKKGISSISLPGNLDYDITGYTVGDKLCDSSISSSCTNGSVTTLNLTIKYKSGQTASSTPISFVADFDFETYYDIKYLGFSSVANLDTGIMDGETSSITFTSTNGIPYGVDVDGSTSSYSNPTLTLTNPSSDITISRKYQVTYVDFTGSTSELPDSIIYSGGNITFDSTSGIPNSVTVTGASSVYQSPILTLSSITGDIAITGSFGGISGSGTFEDPYIDTETVSYDPEDTVTGTTLYESVPGEPKVTVTEGAGGSTTVTGFQFTDTGENGVAYGNNANPTLDTGILVFNNSAFSIHIKFKTNLSQNRAKYILSALSEVNSNSYSGFSLSVADSSTTTLNVSTYINKTYSGSRINPSIDKAITTSSDATSNTENVYEVTMVYNQSNGGQPFILTCTGSNCTSSSQNIHKKYIPTALNNAKITIGGNGLNNINDINSLKVLELHICKGEFGDNYTCN